MEINARDLPARAATVVMSDVSIDAKATLFTSLISTNQRTSWTLNSELFNVLEHELHDLDRPRITDPLTRYHDMMSYSPPTSSIPLFRNCH